MPNRIVIYAKDIMTITGKGERTARRMIAAMKKKLGKPQHAFISVCDFCNHTGLKEEDVKAFIK